MGYHDIEVSTDSRFSSSTSFGVTGGTACRLRSSNDSNDSNPMDLIHGESPESEASGVTTNAYDDAESTDDALEGLTPSFRNISKCWRRFDRVREVTELLKLAG
jgi:hypothetical protein